MYDRLLLTIRKQKDRAQEIIRPVIESPLEDARVREGMKKPLKDIEQARRRAPGAVRARPARPGDGGDYKLRLKSSNDWIVTGMYRASLAKSERFAVTRSAPILEASAAWTASRRAEPGFFRVIPEPRSFESASPARRKSRWFGVTIRPARSNGDSSRSTILRC